MAAHEALETAKIVMEAADVAWAALECCHHHSFQESKTDVDMEKGLDQTERELDGLRSENKRLRGFLEHNVKLLQNLAKTPAISEDCPPDFYERLQSRINSKEFLARLESLNQSSVTETRAQFPFREPTDKDMEDVEVLITVDQEEPSRWVWVNDKKAISTEERSGIDGQHYVVVTDEHVLEGISNFLAKCIASNPKAQNLKPHELQKALSKGLEGMSKFEKTMFLWHAGRMFYTLSTWGLALFGLFQSREALKLAAKGAHATGKVVYRGGKMVVKGTKCFM